MIKKIISTIICVILGISVVLCCIVIGKTALGLDQSVLGFRVFYLVSGSMEPTIPTGAAVLVHRNNSYEVGDVITFESTDTSIYGYPNTHRIVEITEAYGERAYVTKGDANTAADDTVVRESAIYGKVVAHTGKMRWLGTLIGMLTTPLGFITVIILPILAIIASMLRDFTKEYKAALAEEAAGAVQNAAPVIPDAAAPPAAAAEAAPEPDGAGQNANGSKNDSVQEEVPAPEAEQNDDSGSED